MEDDGKPLLDPVRAGESYVEADQNGFDSLDPKSKRPFYVEPRNIVDEDMQERVSAEASVMNSRMQYYSRLTGSSDRQLIPPDHVIPAPDEIYVYSPLGTAFKIQGNADGSGKNPSIITIFAIWNTMMGTSILSIPWGIKQAGFTFGVIIVILMGILTLYCCLRVLKSPAAIPFIDTSSWEFPDVCKYYFGSFGQWSSLAFSMVSLVGAMIVYWVLMSNFLFNTGKFIYNYVHHVNVTDTDVGTNGTDRGTVSVAYLIILVTLKAARLGFHLEFHWFHSTAFFVPEFRSLFPQFTGVLTLAFFIHNCVITLLKNNKNPENNVRDLSVAYLLVGLTYLYVGILIFAVFPSPPLSKDCIEPNFLDNFPSSDILVFIARACLLFQMSTVYPLLGYLVRVQLMGQIFGKPYPRYSGATCGLAYVFVFPSVIHMISLHRSGQLRWPSAVFHSFLIVLGIANLIGQFLM
ncbi:UNVERIFIED_CONTAM: hypothetical protein FKN15_056159 [Acipenser sinensis]